MTMEERILEAMIKQEEYFSMYNIGGSQPKRGFKDGVFNLNNWNCGGLLPLHCIIDVIGLNYEDGLFQESCFKLYPKNLEQKVKVDFEDDLWKVVISKGDSVYSYERYKSRGRIENLCKNGQPITLKEYEELLGYLEDGRLPLGKTRL